MTTQAFDDQGDPRFCRAKSGRVHVVADWQDGDYDPALDPAGWMLIPKRRTMCGRILLLPGGFSDGDISWFADNDLCGKCHKAVDENRQPALFAHPQTEREYDLMVHPWLDDEEAPCPTTTRQ